jgi:hypothetical protein
MTKQCECLASAAVLASVCGIVRFTLAAAPLYGILRLRLPSFGYLFYITLSQVYQTHYKTGTAATKTRSTWKAHHDTVACLTASSYLRGH